jgi:hypothetical protein
MESRRRAPYDEIATGSGTNMPSYYIDRRAQADGSHVVHARDGRQAGCFAASDSSEYLGELLDAGQALALARLNYARVRGCACCDYARPLALQVQEAGASYVGSLHAARRLASACRSTSSTASSSSSSWLASSVAGPGDSFIPLWTS